MSARMLFVGLDAVDPTLLVQWGDEGVLPSFASFSHDAASFALTNAIGRIGGGVWQELNAGRSCGRTGVYFPPRQLHTGETAMRPVDFDEVDPRGYWTAASDAGKRVAVVDLPHTVPPERINGIFVSEWGTHDRFWGTRSVPAGLAGELQRAHGDYPMLSRPWAAERKTACDGHDGSVEHYEELLDDLLEGIERKRRLLLDLLAREEWDLFACAFTEGQCSGHQFWHLRNGGVPAGHERLAGAIRSVYERLDGALGDLIEAAGPEAEVLVVASHGFQEPTGGKQLVPEVLVRLGYGSGSGASARARTKVPPVVRRLARRVLSGGAGAKLRERVGTLPDPLDSPLTKAVALDGDRCSWIRLNLEGREPHGCVEPAAADAMLEELRSQLLALERPDTGERIVATVRTAAEAFGEDHHRDLPDLIVDFRTDLGVLETCRSERAGLVHVPLLPTARRTGAHPVVPSRLWIRARDLPSPAPSGDGSAVDLAATILSRLDVPRPDWLDGAPLV